MEGVLGVLLAPDQSLGEFRSSWVVTSPSYLYEMQDHPFPQVPSGGSDKAPEPRRCPTYEPRVFTGRSSRPAEFWEW